MELSEILKNNIIGNFLDKANFSAKEILETKISESIKEYFSRQKTEKEVDFTVENSTEESHGDYATNVAMALAGVLKKNPLKIAREIVEKIDLPDLLEKVEIATPGFINFTIKQNYFESELKNILAEKENYGRFKENNKKIMVEFGQPNTHKAFTVGHIKGAISGLAVCKLIENLGYKVIKTNYYGDIGMHTAKCTWGVMQKGLPDNFKSWNKHKKMDFIADAYVYASDNFDTNEKAIKQINQDIYDGVKNEATDLYEKIKEWSLEHQTIIFSDLGVVYDKQYSESQVFAEAKKIIDKDEKGIFKKSQGAIVYDGEKDGLATWVMQTSEENPTYSAKDIALGFQKFEDYPDLYLNLTLTAIEQENYFRAIIKILERLDNKFKNKYFHLSFGWLLMDGKKTSSRSGKNIKGTDILEESLRIAKTKIVELKDYDESKREKIARVVSLAGLKFLILSHEFNKNVNYDPERFVNFEGYSGPYILYAYVRAKTILKKSQLREIQPPEVSKVGSRGGFEKSLLKWLAHYPQVTYRAGVEVAPHLLCVYLFELAQRFNSFYAHCPVLDASDREKEFRLAITEGVAQVLKNGLGLLGIETIEEM